MFCPCCLETLDLKHLLDLTLGSYSSDVDPAIPNAFATAAFRFGHSLINPIFSRLDDENKQLSIGQLGLREAFFNPLEY